MSERPSVIKAILCSILLIPLFSIIFIAILLLLGYLTGLLLKSSTFSFLLRIISDPADIMWLFYMIAGYASVSAIGFISGHIFKNYRTQKLTMKIIGGFLLLMAVPSFFVNIINHGYLVPNIVVALCGIILCTSY